MKINKNNYEIRNDMNVVLSKYYIDSITFTHFILQIGVIFLRVVDLILCKQIAQYFKRGDGDMENKFNIFVKFSLVLTLAVPAIYVIISFSNMVESSESSKNGISMARYTALTGEQF